MEKQLISLQTVFFSLSTRLFNQHIQNAVANIDDDDDDYDDDE